MWVTVTVAVTVPNREDAVLGRRVTDEWLHGLMSCVGVYVASR
jgi:hypothetical protein